MRWMRAARRKQAKYEAARRGVSGIRRFGRCRRGVTAVEFALVAVPFLAMLYGVCEAGIQFWSGQVLETAVADASRQLYTGQFQTDTSLTSLTSSQKLAKFKTLVCNRVSNLFACSTMVSVDVQRFASGTTPTVAQPVTNGAYDTSAYGYNPPGPGEIGVVRASMQYPTLMPLSPNGRLRTGKRLIMGTATFRAEPYTTN